MNYNNNPQSQNRRRMVVILIACLLIVAGIVYMKHSSGEQKTLGAPGADGTASPIAVPDTTADPAALPQTADSAVVSQLPDTLLGKDKRDPYEAGYEDGYASGCDDGAAGTDRATYDETNNFRTAAEQHDYVRGYREGYAKGYEDGRQGKQFNI